MTDPELENRLATLAYRHRSPGVRNAEARTARMVCHAKDCPTPHDAVRLYPRGHLCRAHQPALVVSAELPASPPRPARSYGTATTDPLGRDADGWHLSDQLRLPVRCTAACRHG